MLLKGKNVSLRFFRQTDLTTYHNFHLDLKNRGDYLPLTVIPEPIFMNEFQKTGFWGDNEGRMIIQDAQDRIIGGIGFFKSVPYFCSLEISYIIFEETERSKGYMSEALSLFVDFIFRSKNINRLELRISPENLASKRVAEKNHFVFEGIAKKAIYFNGEYKDLDQYAVVKSDWFAHWKKDHPTEN